MKNLLIKGIDNNFYLKDEYNEKEILMNKKKTKYETAKDLDNFFDEFVLKLSKGEFDVDYGTFDSTL